MEFCLPRLDGPKMNLSWFLSFQKRYRYYLYMFFSGFLGLQVKSRLQIKGAVPIITTLALDLLEGNVPKFQKPKRRFEQDEHVKCTVLICHVFHVSRGWFFGLARKWICTLFLSISMESHRLVSRPCSNTMPAVQQQGCFPNGS